MLVLLHRLHDAERDESGSLTPAAAADMKKLAALLEDPDFVRGALSESRPGRPAAPNLLEYEKPDKRGHRRCYDDHTHKQVKCPPKDEPKKGRKKAAPKATPAQVISRAKELLGKDSVTREELHGLLQHLATLKPAEVRDALKGAGVEPTAEAMEISDAALAGVDRATELADKHKSGELTEADLAPLGMADLRALGVLVGVKGRSKDELRARILGGKGAGGKPAAEPEKKPEPEKEAAKAPDEATIEKAARSAYFALQDAAPVSHKLQITIPDLEEEVRKAIPGLTREQFHALLLKWQQEDKITLQLWGLFHIYPEVEKGIDVPRGRYFWVKWKGGRPAAEPEKKPESEKEVAKAPDESAAWDTFRGEFERLNAAGAVQIPDLFAAMRKAHPGLTREDFDRLLLKWRADDRITLTRGYGDAEGVTPGGVEDPSGKGTPFFFVQGLNDSAPPSRQKEPGKKEPDGPQDGEARDGLVFRDGRWHKQDREEKAEKGAEKAKKPWEMTKDELRTGPLPPEQVEAARKAGHPNPESHVRHSLLMAAQNHADHVKEDFFDGPDGRGSPHVRAAEAKLEKHSKEYQRLVRQLEKSELDDLDNHPASKAINRLIVEQAIKDGAPVPPEVLADYPDLAEKYGQKDGTKQPAGPQDGDTKDGLVFRDGRWHKQGEEPQKKGKKKEPASSRVDTGQVGSDIAEAVKNLNPFLPTTLPKLRQEMEKKHPGLTREQFQKEVLKLVASGAVKLAPFTQPHATAHGFDDAIHMGADMMYFVWAGDGRKRNMDDWVGGEVAPDWEDDLRGAVAGGKGQVAIDDLHAGLVKKHPGLSKIDLHEAIRRMIADGSLSAHGHPVGSGVHYQMNRQAVTLPGGESAYSVSIGQKNAGKKEPGKKEPDGPQDGEVRGGLVFRDGRWHRQGDGQDDAESRLQSHQSAAVENHANRTQDALSRATSAEEAVAILSRLGNAEAAHLADRLLGPPDPGDKVSPKMRITRAMRGRYGEWPPAAARGANKELPPELARKVEAAQPEADEVQARMADAVDAKMVKRILRGASDAAVIALARRLMPGLAGDGADDARERLWHSTIGLQGVWPPRPEKKDPGKKEPDGPQDGEVRDGLVFRDGRWHRQGEEPQKKGKKKPAEKKPEPEKAEKGEEKAKEPWEMTFSEIKKHPQWQKIKEVLGAKKDLRGDLAFPDDKAIYQEYLRQAYERGKSVPLSIRQKHLRSSLDSEDREIINQDRPVVSESTNPHSMSLSDYMRILPNADYKAHAAWWDAITSSKPLMRIAREIALRGYFTQSDVDRVEDLGMPSEYINMVAAAGYHEKRHRSAIENSIDRGGKASDKALADYPDLKTKQDWYLENAKTYWSLQSRFAAVESALEAGKPVPPEVLADYPDLAEKYGKKDPGKKEPDGPQDGEVRDGLVFRDGRWHRQEENSKEGLTPDGQERKVPLTPESGTSPAGGQGGRYMKPVEIRESPLTKPKRGGEALQVPHNVFKSLEDEASALGMKSLKGLKINFQGQELTIKGHGNSFKVGKVTCYYLYLEAPIDGAPPAPARRKEPSQLDRIPRVPGVEVTISEHVLGNIFGPISSYPDADPAEFAKDFLARFIKDLSQEQKSALAAKSLEQGRTQRDRSQIRAIWQAAGVEIPESSEGSGR